MGLIGEFYEFQGDIPALGEIHRKVSTLVDGELELAGTLDPTPHDVAEAKRVRQTTSSSMPMRGSHATFRKAGSRRYIDLTVSLDGKTVVVDGNDRPLFDAICKAMESFGGVPEPSRGTITPSPRIQMLIDELDELRKTRDDHWQIPRVEGDLLLQFVLATGAKMIVEVGTSYGFSGLFWAAGLKRTGGKLHTIDLAQKKYDSSRQTFQRAGVTDIVVSHLGNALEVLPTIAGPIDIAFLDADKVLTRKYFDLVWPKIRPGGSVLTDNATTHRDELADFVSHVRSRSDAKSTEIPVGNGLEWTVKTA